MAQIRIINGQEYVLGSDGQYRPRVTIYGDVPPQEKAGGNGTGMMQSIGTSNIPLFTNNNPTGGLLAQLMGGMGNQGILTQSRNNSRLSLTPPPDMRIGLGERLMRVGGAGLAADGMTPNQMLGAMLDQNAVVDDLNRQNALDQYNAQVKALSPFMKAASKGKSKSGLNVAAVPDTAAVMLNIDRSFPRIQEDIDGYINTYTSLGGTATGAIGRIMSLIGGTDANDLQARLETIKGNIGFDKLQRMRDASPTGGALGQVSQMELGQLNASLGNLNIDQSPEQLKQNLLDVRRYYVASVKAIYQEYEQAFREGKIDQNDWLVIQQKLAPAIGGSMMSNQSSTQPDYGNMGEDDLVDSILGN